MPDILTKKMKNCVKRTTSHSLPGVGLWLFQVGRAAFLMSLLYAVIFTASSARGETITVLRLENISKDESLNWVGVGIADMMLCLLRGTNVFDLVERERLGDALEEQAFARSGFVDPAAATKAGRIMKADLALGGGYAVSNDTLSVSAFIVNTTNGQVVATASWQDTQARLLNAPSRLLTGLLATFGKTVSVEDMTRLAQALPRNLDVARAYYQGWTRRLRAIQPERSSIISRSQETPRSLPYCR